MDRGLQASVYGLEVAKQALKLKGWSQEYLSGMAGCTRQTVSRFLAGKRIEKRIALDICNALDLQWGEIETVDADEPINQSPNIDELVEAVRINIYDSIQTRCGSMRVLDMRQPIDLNGIYTNVNILEKITGRQRLDYQKLMQSYSLDNFARFSLSGIQESHIPALEAVDKYSKLMILGKPGAGKTTFLKYLALQCIEGMFKPHLIPLFITLKDFAEADKQPSLIDYIIQLFKSYGIEANTKIKKGLWDSVVYGSDTPVEVLLRHGRFAILLDGLDEVREADSSRVLQQIQGFSNQFAKNLFAITCRIAAREYTFDKFTEVEVSDFDDRQIATFTQQWFQVKEDPIKAENFIKKLKQEPGIRELATSPILLTLLCLVFGESGSFPSNRSELYKEGLDILLKKCDAKRNIQRDQVYQKLSLKRKEDLLSQMALDTFEQGKYFFKQKEAERYITQYIRNLPDANTEEDALQLDSEAVLKSIEAQHGLFVERARGIYSFSHLTFHEYFTARKIVTSANSDVSSCKLAKYVTEKRWREVLLLTVGMLENADLLVQAMKQEIDSILSGDENLQKFLVWVEAKSCSIKSNYKPAAVRAYYLALDLDLALAHDLDLDLDLDPDLALDPELDRSLALDPDSELDREHDQALDPELDRALDLDLDPDLALALDSALIFNVESSKSNRSQQQIKNQYSGYDWQSIEVQRILLQKYYDANKLLVECLNSDCYVSREVREEIESTLLLPIESINKLKSS